MHAKDPTGRRREETAATEGALCPRTPGPLHISTGGRELMNEPESREVEPDGDLYRTIFDLSPEAIVLIDSRGRFVAANGRLEDWLGYSPGEVIGKSLLSAPFIPRATKATIVRNFLRRMSGKDIPPYEVEFRTKSGDTRYGRIHATIARNADGRAFGDLVMISDVSELRAAEKSLVRRSKELGERVKELTCLHEISKLAIEPSLSLDQFLRRVVELLPPALQHPELAGARIRLGEREFRTERFEDTPWMLSADISSEGKAIGRVDLSYSKDGSDGVFLEEERALIETVAERIGHMVMRKRSERQLERSEAKTRALLNAPPDFMILTDREGRVVAANEGSATLLEVPLEDLVGAVIFDFFPDEMAERRRADAEKVLRTGEPVFSEDEVEGRFYHSRIYPISDERGDVVQMAAFSRDVTEEVRVRRRLAESRRKIEGLHDAARRLGRCDTRDEACRITIEAVRDVLGFPVCVAHMAVGDSLIVRSACSELPPGLELDETTPRDSAAMRAFRENRTVVCGNGPGSACTHCPDVFRSAVCVPVGDTGVFEVLSPEEDAFDEEDVRLLELLLGHTTEAVRGVAMREELEQQVVRDPLTGLFNRRYLKNITGQEVERARRYGHRIGFLMVDVDNFKEINDTLGHQVGDLVLRQVSRYLRAMVRATEFVVRYGGDEFLLVMPESGPDGESVILRLQRAFGPWSEELPTGDIPVRLSMGFDVWEPAEGRSVDEVIASADDLMYEDKKLHNSERSPVSADGEA
ncbi:MAG: diguanylate cyclase [Candidatus Eisenbacteria bacterium]|nr:diguanylate cyclase [Candidatus Eisenbacteria bacterium]